MRRTLPLLLGAVIVASRAQAQDPYVLLSHVTKACDAVQKSKVSYKKLEHFCGLYVGPDITPDQLRDWAVAKIPPIEAVIAYPTITDPSVLLDKDKSPDETVWAVNVKGIEELKETSLGIAQLTAVWGASSRASNVPRAAAGDSPLAGGTLESAVLWGLTEFIYDRAKQELNYMAMEQLHPILCKNGHVAAYLEQTCAVLAHPSDEVLTLPGIATFKSIVESDVRAAPLKALKMAADQTSELPPDAREVTNYVIEYVGEVVAGAEPLVALKHMAHRYASSFEGPRPIVRETQPMSTALHEMAWWVATMDLDVGPGQQWDPILKASVRAVVINAAWSAAWPCVTLAPNGKSCGDPRDGHLTAGVNTLIDRAMRAQTLVQDSRQVWSTFRETMRNKDATRAERIAQYARVASNATRLAEIALPPNSCSDKQRIACFLPLADRVIIAVGAESYGEALAAAKLAVDTLKLADKLVLNSQQVRVLSFAVDIAQSKDAEGVTQAIGRFAAPLHSYRSKRTPTFGTGYAKLNAYAGGGYGHEDLTGSGAPGGSSKIGGAWMPVGIELGLRSKAGSFGMLGQIVDLGALFSYRLDQSNDVDSRPPATVRQVFSPGIFFMWGVLQLPVAVGWGHSWMPYGRTLTSAGSIGAQVSSTQTRWVLAIDVPLFP